MVDFIDHMADAIADRGLKIEHARSPS